MSVEMAGFVILFVSIIFFVIAIWAGLKNSKRKEDEIVRKYHEDVTGIFVEIGNCFAHHGFVFEHKFRGREHSGRTLRDTPGMFMSFEPFINDSYRIKLQRTDSDDISLDVKRARDVIHREVATPLVSLSQNPQCLSIRSIFALKKAGIEKLVTDLVNLQKKYDEIWSDLEACKIPERLAGFLKLYDEEYNRYMQAIDIVVNRHFPTETEKKVS